MFKSRGSLDLQNKLTLAVIPIVDDAFIPCSRGSNRQCQRITPQISMSLRCILHHQHEVETLRALQQLALNQIIERFVHCFIDGRIRSCCWKTLDTRGCCTKDGRTTLAPKDRRTCIRKPMTRPSSSANTQDSRRILLLSAPQRHRECLFLRLRELCRAAGDLLPLL